MAAPDTMPPIVLAQHDPLQLPHVLATIRAGIDGIKAHGGLNSPEAHILAASVATEAMKLVPDASKELAKARETFHVHHAALVADHAAKRAAALTKKVA